MTPTESKSETIALVTPLYDGRSHDDHSCSIEDGRNALRQHGYRTVRKRLRGDAILPRVRNQCVAEALAAGADQIVFVDSDIGFEPATLLRLVRHGADIVGAAPQGQLFNWRAANAPRLVWRPMVGETRTDEHGLLRVAGLATGFMKVRARVFPALVAAGLAHPYIYPGLPPSSWKHLAMYFEYTLAPIDAENDPDLTRQCDEAGIPAEQRLRFEGEDYVFCEKARKAGFESYLDVAIGVRHWEGRCVHDFSLAEANARAAQSQAAKPREAAD